MNKYEFTEIFLEGMHLCYIYSDEDEREHTMAAFFARGFSQGLKALSIVDTIHPHDVRYGAFLRSELYSSFISNQIQRNQL